MASIICAIVGLIDGCKKKCTNKSVPAITKLINEHFDGCMVSFVPSIAKHVKKRCIEVTTFVRAIV